MIRGWRGAGGPWGVVTAVAVAFGAPGVGPAGAVAQGGVGNGFGWCEVEGYGGPARCGVVEVAESPGSEGGRVLSLKVVVLEARGPEGDRAPDPVFVLDGGPGQAATRSVGWVVEELAAVLATRDVVLVDRRGTGGSNGLDCPAPRGGVRAWQTVPPADVAAECRAALAGRADLTKYTSPYAADDLDAVRAALGYERINVYGGSYGSREAFEYMRRHGGRLRSGVVFAVTPQHRAALLSSPATAETALQRLLDDCMADVSCRAAYPDVRRELREVVTRLESEPAPYTVESGGREDTLALTRTQFGSLVRTLLLSPTGGAQVPYLIDLARRGGWQEIGGLFARLAGGMEGALSRGLFLSVVCAEEAAFVDRSEIRTSAAGTFWGSGWPESIVAQCDVWPAGDLPADWRAPPAGNSPFLFLAGWLDPIASPAWAQELTRWMPNARRVVVREGHHNFRLDACGRETLARFYDTGDPFNLEVGCIAGVKRPPFLVP